jgi:glycosyltransferase involved in cell wall biosynthesis
MRCVIDATSLRPGRITGIERYTQHVVMDVPSQLPDWDWHAIFRDDLADIDWLPSHVQAHRVPAKHRIVRDQYSLLRKFRGLRPDLAHFPAFPPPLMIKAARRVILTVHDATYWLYPDTLSSGARWYYKPSLEVQLRRRDRIDGVLSDSVSAAGDLERVAGFHAKIEGIPLGVDQSFHPEALQNALEADPADQYILSVGTREPRKNIETVMAAYAALVRMGAQVPKLLIIGRRGWGRPLEVPPDILDRVEFVDTVTDKQLAAYYRRCSLFVIPSRYEGFGLPLLEALASGAPCVAADIPVFHEVAGDAARYVPADDVQAWTHAIKELLEDPAQCATLSELGMGRAATFTWRAWAIKTAHAYEQMSTL